VTSCRSVRAVSDRILRASRMQIVTGCVPERLREESVTNSGVSGAIASSQRPCWGVGFWRGRIAALGTTEVGYNVG
jgi:hypothetical protein